MGERWENVLWLEGSQLLRPGTGALRQGIVYTAIPDIFGVWYNLKWFHNISLPPGEAVAPARRPHRGGLRRAGAEVELNQLEIGHLVDRIDRVAATLAVLAVDFSRTSGRSFDDSHDTSPACSCFADFRPFRRVESAQDEGDRRRIAVELERAGLTDRTPAPLAAVKRQRI